MRNIYSQKLKGIILEENLSYYFKVEAKCDPIIGVVLSLCTTIQKGGGGTDHKFQSVSCLMF